MKKLDVASEEVEKLFDSVRFNTTIPMWVEFKVLANNKQKELFKLVKASEILELLAEGVNFVLIVNEEIFFGLPGNMQSIAIDEVLAGVKISETDALSIDRPNFNTYTGVLSKYGDAEIIKLHESIISLFDNKKHKEDELKANSKGKRGRRKKD
jgi:hypothetical protein